MALSTSLLWHYGTACLASHGTLGPFTWALRRLLKRLACLEIFQVEFNEVRVRDLPFCRTLEQVLPSYTSSP
jgi:hypothetical protein